ncbi:MAG: hypothetical protein KAX78_04720, partial [Phycisphaerae bacterium]|nr:hypothetical protein [Phycisphaerae bacterium]
MGTWKGLPGAGFIFTAVADGPLSLPTCAHLTGQRTDKIGYHDFAQTSSQRGRAAASHHGVVSD